MINYAEWLRRAERFMRGTSTLPGTWSMEIAIEPPLDSGEADRLASKLPHGLPQPLRHFYLTASANAVCSFSWNPPPAELAKLNKVIPHESGIYGSTKFCPAAELAEHHEQLLGWEENFREAGGYGPAAAQTLLECVPLISVGNGDYVALHVKAAPGAASVVYVSHDTNASEESPIIPLARNMDEFLLASERLGYLGPEIWLLATFLEDSQTGLLDADSKLARKWRTLTASLGFPAIA